MVQLLVRTYGKAARLDKRLTPHVWRHTCATHLVGAGANLACVQRLLGHASLQTTQCYARVAVPQIHATHRRAHPRNRIRSRA